MRVSDGRLLKEAMARWLSGGEVVTGSAGSAINRPVADKASTMATQRINANRGYIHPGTAMTPAQSRISGFDEGVADICFHVR